MSNLPTEPGAVPDDNLDIRGPEEPMPENDAEQEVEFE